MTSLYSRQPSHLLLVLSPQISLDAVRGMPEESNPTGVKWLCHPKAMQTYMSLLGSSQKDATLEACCGALQNLTALKGAVRTKTSMIRTTICVLGFIRHSGLSQIHLNKAKSNRDGDVEGIMSITHNKD